MNRDSEKRIMISWIMILGLIGMPIFLKIKVSKQLINSIYSKTIK